MVFLLKFCKNIFHGYPPIPSNSSLTEAISNITPQSNSSLTVRLHMTQKKPTILRPWAVRLLDVRRQLRSRQDHHLALYVSSLRQHWQGCELNVQQRRQCMAHLLELDTLPWRNTPLCQWLHRNSIRCGI